MEDAAREENSKYVLLVRNGAWGLPTACPNCLPSFLYLKFACLNFQVEYAPRLPDSEDLPILEYGLYAAFSSEAGGIEGFLKKERIVDLDSGLTDSEKSDLQAYKSLATTWLADATLYELWSKDNETAVHDVYFSALPWPIPKVLDWKMRRSVFQKLGITAENAAHRGIEILSKASAAYEALSLKLRDQKYLLETKPTSLDAVVLSHILFHLHAPLENSRLKEELLKHNNLVMYAEIHKAELMEQGIPSPSSSPSPVPASASTPASRPSASTSTAGTSEKTRKKADVKDAIFKKRARYFVLTQLAVVILYVVLTGIRYEDEVVEDDNSHDD